MKKPTLLIATALLGTVALAQDPVETDGDKYRTILENECVRVLEYRDGPGQKTREHRHPAFVVYALAPFERSLHLPDGRVLKREFKAGDAMWSDAQTHIGENTGTTPTHILMIEIKMADKPCRAN